MVLIGGTRNFTLNTISDIQGVLGIKYRNHVFYPFLFDHNKHTKSDYFNDFEELLKRLNVNKLNSYVLQLEQLNFPMPDIEILKLYLQHTKQNSYKFATLLKGILQ